MTDDIEIIFSAHDLFQVDIGIEDGFAGEIRAGLPVRLYKAALVSFARVPAPCRLRPYPPKR